MTVAHPQPENCMNANHPTQKYPEDLGENVLKSIEEYHILNDYLGYSLTLDTIREHTTFVSM